LEGYEVGDYHDGESELRGSFWPSAVSLQRSARGGRIAALTVGEQPNGGGSRPKTASGGPKLIAEG
jgi:hypothetical protein